VGGRRSARRCEGRPFGGAVEEVSRSASFGASRLVMWGIAVVMAVGGGEVPSGSWRAGRRIGLGLWVGKAISSS
jgi:hypothetical protein